MGAPWTSENWISGDFQAPHVLIPPVKNFMRISSSIFFSRISNFNYGLSLTVCLQILCSRDKERNLTELNLIPTKSSQFLLTLTFQVFLSVSGMPLYSTIVLFSCKLFYKKCFKSWL